MLEILQYIFFSHKGFHLPEINSASLQWRHNGLDSVSNHQPHGCLLNRLFGRRSKKTSKLRVTGLCVGNSPGTGEFPAQMVSNAENVSIWWRHHDDKHTVCQFWIRIIYKKMAMYWYSYWVMIYAWVFDSTSLFQGALVKTNCCLATRLLKSITKMSRKPRENMLLNLSGEYANMDVLWMSRVLLLDH